LAILRRSIRKMSGRKNPFIYKGVLESAGLGEVAYFLEKAKENIRYAAFTLDHTDFDTAKRSLHASAGRFDDLGRLLAELQQAVESIGNEVAEDLIEDEFAVEEQE
jgi:hypothetical protein